MNRLARSIHPCPRVGSVPAGTCRRRQHGLLLEPHVGRSGTIVRPRGHPARDASSPMRRLRVSGIAGRIITVRFAQPQDAEHAVVPAPLRLIRRTGATWHAELAGSISQLLEWAVQQRLADLTIRAPRPGNAVSFLLLTCDRGRGGRRLRRDARTAAQGFLGSVSVYALVRPGADVRHGPADVHRAPIAGRDWPGPGPVAPGQDDDRRPAGHRRGTGDDRANAPGLCLGASGRSDDRLGDETLLCTRLPGAEIDYGTIDFLLGQPVSRRATLLFRIIHVAGVGNRHLVGGTRGALVQREGCRLRPGRVSITSAWCSPTCIACTWRWEASPISWPLARTAAARRWPSSSPSSWLPSCSPSCAHFWLPAERLAFLSVLDYYQPARVLSGHDLPWRDCVVLVTLGAAGWLAGGEVFARRSIATV